MFTIQSSVIYEETIKKSVFIGHLIPISTPEDAQDTLLLLKKKHPNANHFCYAYILGDDGSVYKYSDDGEPSQTAGIVIFEVLRKKMLTNVLCVVVRIFGGIKLGAGGLVRAYANGANGAVNMATIDKLVPKSILKLQFDYPYANEILRLFASNELLFSDYGIKISLHVVVETERIPNYRDILIDITKNTISIEVS